MGSVVDVETEMDTETNFTINSDSENKAKIKTESGKDNKSEVTADKKPKIDDKIETETETQTESEDESNSEDEIKPKIESNIKKTSVVDKTKLKKGTFNNNGVESKSDIKTSTVVDKVKLKFEANNTSKVKTNDKTSIDDKTKLKGELNNTLEVNTTTESENETENLVSPPEAENQVFPPEILVKILRQLSTQDLLLNVAPVCKQFHQLTKDPSIHTRIALPCYVDLDPALEFLRVSSKVRELKIFTTKEMELELNPVPANRDPSERQEMYCDPILMAVSEHANLQEVEVEGMTARVSCFNELNKTTFFKNLTKLVVKVNADSVFPYDRQQLETTLTLLASTGKLKHLNLTGIKKISSSSITHLALACNQLDTLSTDCNMTNADHISILQARHSTLKHLKIESNHHWTMEVFDNLGKCDKMEKLTEYIYPVFKVS
jgi:hypothetical protein